MESTKTKRGEDWVMLLSVKSRGEEEKREGIGPSEENKEEE